MPILTDAPSRPAALVRERDRVDTFALIALTLSFALAMIGLVLTANPRPDFESSQAFATVLGP